MSAEQLSRRQTVAALAATVACTLAGSSCGTAEANSPGRLQDCTGPSFSAIGPNADLYGAKEDYPLPDIMDARRQGDPWQPKYRVGAFTHLDQIYPTRLVRRAGSAWKFKCSTAEIYYDFGGGRRSLIDYMSRNPVTGLLIAKDDQILFERYQFARTDRDRFVSQSMIKSMIGLLIGVAISDGTIKSIDDSPETYVRGFRGSEYGKTPIRDLLHMSSGVDFGETTDGQRDLNRLWIDMVLGLGPTKGTINSIVQFNRRIAPPGTKYFYASIEADVVGVVLHHAVNQLMSDYLQEKLWEPIGAEADAAWVIDAQGFEVAHCCFNAVLR